MTGSDLETRVTGDRQRPAPLYGSGLEPGRIVGRYELLQKLGHGGMATVYLGRATGTAGFAKRVAIKVIHPHLATEAEFVEMFLDEARLAAELGEELKATRSKQRMSASSGRSRSSAAADARCGRCTSCSRAPPFSCRCMLAARTPSPF